MEPQLPREPTNVENDEIIAHALQEELSHLAAVEASGDPHPTEDHLQASILAQDWLGPSQRISSEGAWHVDKQQESSHEQEVASPCSSLERRSQDGSENVYTSLELLDEFSALDGEVGKRLTQMNSVPHIPRINGDIPTMDEATTDHQRLLDRLTLYDLRELKIPGDGNCQFRALSDQFYRTPKHHEFVRQQVVEQLKSEPELYEGYVPMPYDEYLKKLASLANGATMLLCRLLQIVMELKYVSTAYTQSGRMLYCVQQPSIGFKDFLLKPDMLRPGLGHLSEGNGSAPKPKISVS